jgi:predicted ATPase/class 3 adenylate cyclase
VYLPVNVSARLLTFLFTDIEGSTRLWEADADAMRASLARHDEILATACVDGDLFKHTGDGVCAAFDAPTAALRAAAAAQRALADEPWATADPIRVRMGVHTGEAEYRDGDYFGVALNRTARLMDAAHGGQVVVSASTGALVDPAADGVALRDLGEHRFKDLRERERVFEMGIDGLERAFPPLRSLETYATNLPVQLTSFVGRSAELAEVSALLGESRLVTLTGVGGVGKTRLAVQAAAETIDHYPDGVWLVELAPITDPGLVLGQAAAALGVREEPGRPLEDVLVDRLHDRTLLVVLDNCEHLIDEAAKLAERLLRAVPGLTLLATSREGLGIGGERLWQVPSLTRQGAQADAMSLFVERARMVRPGFRLDADTTDTVAAICARLDGIPLAIELAAARLRVFTVTQVAERLGDRFRLLTGGSRTALPRQRTLEATMDWSYDLLAEREQTLLRRLSVFAGGFTFDAAEEVCGGDPLDRAEVLDLLTHLIDTSLVTVDDTPRG